MRTRSILIMIAAAAAGALGIMACRDALAKHEEPNYEVLHKSGDIEVRQYPPVIVAEVEVEGTREKSANQAFSILAGYIFGKNVSRDKIAMTVPVTETISSEKIAMTVPVTSSNTDGKMTMRFYLPSKYSLEQLPEPLDKRIKFEKIHATRYAVLRFSGVAHEDSFARHEARLLKYLEDSELKTHGEAIRAFYNPPWTLPFMRRNEIWLTIETTSS